MAEQHSKKSFSGRTPSSENLTRLIEATTERIKELALSSPVTGDKIYFENSAVIPVSKVSAGFAGGTADILNYEKKAADGGAGAGGKVTITPMAFIVREESGIKIVGIPDGDEKSQRSGLFSGLIGAGMEALAAKKAAKTDSEITVTESDSVEGGKIKRKFRKSTEIK